MTLSKSADFVIHRLEQLRTAKGNGIQVRVENRLIDRIDFYDGCAQIVLQPPTAADIDRALSAFIAYRKEHGADADPREAMRVVLGAKGETTE